MSAKSDFPSESADKYIVRFPDGMRALLKASAAANHRSLNAEIVARLATSGPASEPSRRDAFAGQAMAAMLAGHVSHYGHDNHWPSESLASQAYEMADAMVKAGSA